MKILAITATAALGLLVMAGAAIAQVYVDGYYKSDGTYVAPIARPIGLHYRLG